MQMFLAGENDDLMELLVNTIDGGMVYLMAAYYVFSVEYPKPYTSHFSILFKTLLWTKQTMVKSQLDMPLLLPQ